jgi:hypothetical protein
MSDARGARLTDFGLPGIAEVPYGVHACHFYDDRDDLAAALAPYIAAGLRNNERCLWITAEPLLADDAKVALARTGIDVEAELRKGALQIRDYSEWYLSDGKPKNGDVVARWLAEEERALADGYRGLRITGNPSFLTEATWSGFMDYESLLNEALKARHIVTLCTYPHTRCGPAEVADVLRRHDWALGRPDTRWKFLPGKR